jgi:DNA-binding FrmR family transcriptional regulator
LKRVEGQIRGLQRMVDEDEYCIDVLTQISAATAALRSISLGLLDEHVRHCVANAEGDQAEAMVSEAIAAVERLVKS